MSSALGKRVASGVTLAGIVLAALAWLPDSGRAAFFLLFALVAAYEWAKLAGVSGAPALIGGVAATGALLVVLWLLPPARTAMLVAAAVFWLVAAVVVCMYPASARLVRHAGFALPVGLLALGGAWCALTTLPPAVVIWVLAAVAAADTCAYFAGRRFGTHRLAPRASPGKTWEGAAGGAVGALGCGVVAAWWADAPLAAWLGLAAALFAASVVGDLFESVLKRTRGVKDSGALLPGHGGVLDRVDSVLAAAPAVALLHGLFQRAALL